MARKSSRRLTEQERAERRRQYRERLHHAAEQLLSSEGWKRWVRVRSKAGLARLSISKQLLVALARPDATFVAGFNTWLRLGYAVRKGERAVVIIAPLPVKERDRMTGVETGDTMMLFKTVFVFDRLSRVRSGGCRRRPSPEIRCLPVSRLCCSSAHAPRRYPREQKRADQTPECCIAGVRWAAAVASVGATPGVPHQQPARGSTALPLRPVGPLPGFGRLATWLLGPPEARRARRARGREDGWTRPPTR